MFLTSPISPIFHFSLKAIRVKGARMRAEPTVGAMGKAKWQKDFVGYFYDFVRIVGLDVRDMYGKSTGNV